MTDERVQSGGRELVIKTKPLTVVVPGSSHHLDIKYLDRMVIDVATASYHAERVIVWHDDTAQWVKQILNLDEDITAEQVQTMGIGSITISGFIDLSLKFRDMGVPFVLKYPESHLHPKCQASLADFCIQEMPR